MKCRPPGSGRETHGSTFRRSIPTPIRRRPAMPMHFPHPKPPISRRAWEFVLPYEAVRRSSDPEATLMAFLQTTYQTAADLGGWDRAALECEVGVPGRPRAPGICARKNTSYLALNGRFLCVSGSWMMNFNMPHFFSAFMTSGFSESVGLAVSPAMCMVVPLPGVKVMKMQPSRLRPGWKGIDW